MALTTRLKKSKTLIRLIRSVELSINNLIYPIFVREDGKTFGIPSMSGQMYHSLDSCVEICKMVVELGIPAVMIFGVLKEKNIDGSIALKADAFHSKIFRTLKKEIDDELVLISNICLCDFTEDEFCVYTDERGKVLDQKTAEMLSKIAVAHAEAGADIVAPAAMCDGQVRYIRKALDNAGFEDVAIMSYVKTDSCLFQPFFEAMTSADTPRRAVDPSKFRTDVINEKMFMQKVELDISEGADMVIVKPALPNLDHILRVKQKYPTIPFAAYQVSGEYAMIKLLSEHAHVNEKSLLMETLSSIKRAGADMILTYNAIEVARMLRGML